MFLSLNHLWYHTPYGWQVLLEPPLALASLVYYLGLKTDQFIKRAKQKRLPRPVISVGNLTVGGTGKTPLTLFLANLVVERGKTPCILSRGYGSDRKDPVQVPSSPHPGQRFGDETVLLAQQIGKGYVYQGAQRHQAGLLALAEHPDIDVFLLDDGFQHLALHRDLDLLLVDADRGFGNGHLLPWGPLREPVGHLQRAHLVGMVSHDSMNIIPPSLRSDFTFSLVPAGWRRLGDSTCQPLDSLPKDRPAHLVSGIGSPAGFEKTARAAGLHVLSHSIYRDHHPFTSEELTTELKQASRSGAVLVTTAKDAIRMCQISRSWTSEEAPIIIELGLKSMDGFDKLIHNVNVLWS